jgi:hypothetical protein
VNTKEIQICGDTVTIRELTVDEFFSIQGPVINDGAADSKTLYNTMVKYIAAATGWSEDKIRSMPASCLGDLNTAVVEINTLNGQG